MDKIIGFDRAEVFGQALALLFYAAFGRKNVASIIRNQNRATKIAQLLNVGLAPSKTLVQQAIDRMPMSPFGAPGITDTTKFDGNLAEQFPKPKDTYWLKDQVISAGQVPQYEKINTAKFVPTGGVINAEGKQTEYHFKPNPVYVDPVTDLEVDD